MLMVMQTQTQRMGVHSFSVLKFASRRTRCYGSFPPTETESDSDSDSKPYRYIVLCKTFSTGTDWDFDPCMDRFPNGYCTDFRDRSPSQGYESESISVGGNEPLNFNFDRNANVTCEWTLRYSPFLVYYRQDILTLSPTWVAL